MGSFSFYIAQKYEFLIAFLNGESTISLTFVLASRLL